MRPVPAQLSGPQRAAVLGLGCAGGPRRFRLGAKRKRRGRKRTRGSWPRRQLLWDSVLQATLGRVAARLDGAVSAQRDAGWPFSGCSPPDRAAEHGPTSPPPNPGRCPRRLWDRAQLSRTGPDPRVFSDATFSLAFFTLGFAAPCDRGVVLGVQAGRRIRRGFSFSPTCFGAPGRWFAQCIWVRYVCSVDCVDCVGCVDWARTPSGRWGSAVL
jgi:hypothetical protein